MPRGVRGRGRRAGGTPLGGASSARATASPQPRPPPAVAAAAAVAAHWSLNVSVIDASAGAARVLVNTTAALSFPISLTLGAITAEIVGDGSAGAAQHSDEAWRASVGASRWRRNERRTSAAPSGWYHGALGDLLQRLVDGGSARLCIMGDRVGRERRCASVQRHRGSGGGGGGSGVGECVGRADRHQRRRRRRRADDGSVHLPSGVRAVGRRVAARAASTNFTLRVALPALPPPRRTRGRARLLPPAAVDVQIVQFPAVAAVAVPAPARRRRGAAVFPRRPCGRQRLVRRVAALHGTGQSAAAGPPLALGA